MTRPDFEAADRTGFARHALSVGFGPLTRPTLETLAQGSYAVSSCCATPCNRHVTRDNSGGGPHLLTAGLHLDTVARKLLPRSDESRHRGAALGTTLRAVRLTMLPETRMPYAPATRRVFYQKRVLKPDAIPGVVFSAPHRAVEVTGLDSRGVICRTICRGGGGTIARIEASCSPNSFLPHPTLRGPRKDALHFSTGSSERAPRFVGFLEVERQQARNSGDETPARDARLPLAVRTWPLLFRKSTRTRATSRKLCAPTKKCAKTVTRGQRTRTGAQRVLGGLPCL